MHRWLVAAMLGLLASTTALPVRAEQLMVGLQIQDYRLQLQYPNAVHETRLSRLDLLWHEHLTPWLDGRIRLGTLLLSQGSNPLPAGQSTHGNALGLGLDFWLYQGEVLSVRARTDYLYVDSRASLDNQTVDQRWHQLSGELQADFRLPHYSSLNLSAGHLIIDGEESASGAVNTLSSFHSKNPVYAKVGVLLGLDPDSHIGIEISTGSIRGGYITFQRWF